MKTYIFPGQGSQKKGMGEHLFCAFKELTAKANEILGYDIEELCLKDVDNLLGKTEYTQPALYTVNAMAWLKTVAEDGEPDFTAGHSLGEYNALLAAGAFDFETGLKFVKERGRLMAQAQSGGMAAVIGLDEEKIKHIIQEGGFEHIAIANYNTPVQLVISGAKEEIKEAESFFKKEGASYVILKVSGAFHSSFMTDAAKEMGHLLGKAVFSDMKFPVISNVTAQPYEKKENIAKLLQTQMASSVRWTESVTYLLRQGDMTFIEIGPGNVLTKLVNAIRKHADSVVTP